MGFKVAQLTGVSADALFQSLRPLRFGGLGRFEGAVSVSRNPGLMWNCGRVRLDLFYWPDGLAGDHTWNGGLPLAGHGLLAATGRLGKRSGTWLR